jgi:hypothetical protein
MIKDMHVPRDDERKSWYLHYRASHAALPSSSCSWYSATVTKLRRNNSSQCALGTRTLIPSLRLAIELSHSRSVNTLSHPACLTSLLCYITFSRHPGISNICSFPSVSRFSSSFGFRDSKYPQFFHLSRFSSSSGFRDFKYPQFFSSVSLFQQFSFHTFKVSPSTDFKYPQLFICLAFPAVFALASLRNNCTSKLQTDHLVREGVPQQENQQFSKRKQNSAHAPQMRARLQDRQVDWPSVERFDFEFEVF